jgi:hypothetical protein
MKPRTKELFHRGVRVGPAGMVMYPCPEAQDNGYLIPPQPVCPYCGAVLVPPDDEGAG